MGLVHHHECIVFLREVADLVHRGHVSVHREHAVGYDNPEPLGLRLLEAALEVFHIGVGVTVPLCLAQAHTVNDGGVVEGIGNDGVLFGEQRLEHSAVCVEAGGVKYGVLGLEIVADGCFKLFVDVLGAADEAHGRHSEAPFLHHSGGCLHQTRVVCQS